MNIKPAPKEAPIKLAKKSENSDALSETIGCISSKIMPYPPEIIMNANNFE